MNASTYPVPSASGERLLWWCVGLSRLLHALVLWQGHISRSSAPPPPQIVATIRTAPAAAPPAPVVEPKPEPPKPEPKVETPKPPEPAKQLVKPVPDKAAPKVPVPEPKAAAPTPAPAPSTPTPAEAKSEPKGEPAKAAPVAVPNAGATSGANDADDLAFVRSYQLNLAQVTNKYKVYPAVALQQEWQGTTLVRLIIGADTRIKSVEIGASSGHEMLDEKAREAVTKAKPLVAVPERLKGKEFIAEIRVVYTLEKK